MAYIVQLVRVTKGTCGEQRFPIGKEVRPEPECYDAAKCRAAEMYLMTNLQGNVLRTWLEVVAAGKGLTYLKPSHVPYELEMREVKRVK